MDAGLAILGCGGHARSIADVALSLGYSKLCFVDHNAKLNETILGFPVIKSWRELLTDDWYFFPGSGDNMKRSLVVEELEKEGLQIATLISSTATVGAGSVLGKGIFVAHHTHIGPLAKIGMGCIINTGAIVEHDVSVGNFTHISVNSTIAGSSHIGSHCFIGAGATVIDNISIGDNIAIGAGACVVRDIKDAGSYIGVPAKRYDRC